MHFRFLKDFLFKNLLEKEVTLEGSGLGGILSKIYDYDPTNWKNNVECTAGDVLSQSNPYLVFSPVAEKNWYTDKGYIRVHLKQSIRIHSYKIHSEHNNPGAAHPKSWAFQGSNDGVNWDTLHEEKDNPALNGRDIVKEFKTKSRNNYSYYQVLKTGDSWNPTAPKRLSLLMIDIFQKTCFCSFKPRQKKLTNNVFFALFMIS